MMASSMKAKVCFLVALSFFGFIFCEQVHFTKCRRPTLGFTNKCDVHDVQVDPCPEAASNLPCLISHNSNASITFSYTPQFSGTIESRAYWAQAFIDVPFVGMDTDGCKYSKCPTEAGVKNNFHFALPISSTYPAGLYPVKWRVWNKQSEECCFLLKIKIVNEK